MTKNISIVKCLVCSADLEGGSLFCGFCGNSLARNTKCSSCGKIILDVYNYCNYCGNNLGKSHTTNLSITTNHNDNLSTQNSANAEKREERRLISVLFADVKGFTAMSENLDPEKVKEIMNQVFEMLTEIIVDEGGTIDKYIGEYIQS